jgi:lipoprotein NlpD
MNSNINRSIILIIITLIFPFQLFSDEVYIFRAGDTLYSLSKKFGLPVSDIQTASGITDPTNIMIGTKIIIPDSESSDSYFYYSIESGDTLYSLSKRNNVSLDKLYSLNSLSETSILKVGMQIKIPNTVTQIDQNTITADTYHNNYTQNNVNSDSTPYWPHPGRIEELNGELSKAVIIIGSRGDPVVSVSSGVVTWAGPFRGYGKMVFIKCSNGYVFGYGGNEELFVNTGDNINIGTKLGTMGINSHDGIAKVFFFVAKNGIPQKPEQVPRS